LLGTTRQVVPDQVGIQGESRVGLDGRQSNDDWNDETWLPTNGPCGVPTRAHVPTDAPEDPPEVVDLGLDLDHQQRAVRCPVRQHVDPPAEPTLADLHLRSNLPAALLELSRYVAAAPSVDQVVLLSATCQSDRVRVDRHPDPEQIQGGTRQSDVQVGLPPCLETLDGGLIRTKPAGEFALGPAECLAR
jgi:hypothetical protein